MTEPSPDPMIGRLLDGRYQVRSRIARGGMATVYVATDLRLERRVAVKIMHGHLADDMAFKNRFVQEARSAARLAHPNVVNVFDQGQDDSLAYLVMEYLPGITLRDLLRDYGTLTAEQTIDIVDAVLRGLGSAHRAGLIHRDVKPENVLLADDGRIKLGDFGLARATSNNTATGTALLGTIAYLSPELVTRGIADARSDVYALGIMMYEMLTGQQPYNGEQPMQIAYQHANDEVPAPSDRNPNVPAQLDELVLWATARDPDERPRDAGEMLDRLMSVEHSLRDDMTPTDENDTLALPRTDLTEAAEAPTALTDSATMADTATVDSAPTPRDTVTTLTRLSRRRRRSGWLLFCIVLLLAGLAGGTGWYFGSGPGSLVVVPTVSGHTADDAQALLGAEGLAARTTEVFSLSVDEGVVVGSTPAEGTRVAKDSTVSIAVSQGPKPITLPTLRGLALDEAKAKIDSSGAVVDGDVAEQFDSEVDEGAVITATKAAGDKQDVSEGGDYYAGMPVALTVSLGAVPDVAGMSEDDATSALDDVGLKLETTDPVYSNDVDEGDVVDVSLPEAPITKGDTVTVTLSQGPELFEVPDVTGQTRDEATDNLENASGGFVVKYTHPFWFNGESAPDQITTVVSIDPSAGTELEAGSTVTIRVEIR